MVKGHESKNGIIINKDLMVYKVLIALFLMSYVNCTCFSQLKISSEILSYDSNCLLLEVTIRNDFKEEVTIENFLPQMYDLTQKYSLSVVYDTIDSIPNLDRMGFIVDSLNVEIGQYNRFLGNSPNFFSRLKKRNVQTRVIKVRPETTLQTRTKINFLQSHLSFDIKSLKVFYYHSGLKLLVISNEIDN